MIINCNNCSNSRHKKGRDQEIYFDLNNKTSTAKLSKYTGLPQSQRNNNNIDLEEEKEAGITFLNNDRIIVNRLRSATK